MIKAIRIEHSDGYGPFVTWDINGNYRNVVDNETIYQFKLKHNKFNTPEKDNIGIQDNEFCAYKSLEQLSQWLTLKELNVMIANDFRVFELSLSNYSIGRDNVVFNEKSVIEKIDITDKVLEILK